MLSEQLNIHHFFKRKKLLVAIIALWFLRLYYFTVLLYSYSSYGDASAVKFGIVPQCPTVKKYVKIYCISPVVLSSTASVS